MSGVFDICFMELQLSVFHKFNSHRTLFVGSVRIRHVIELFKMKISFSS